MPVEASLFFTPDEIECLQMETIPVNTVTLNGIVYIDPSHWTVWINNHELTPHIHHSMITIQSVTQQQVVFIYTANDEDYTVTLNVNETIDLSAQTKLDVFSKPL
jgi:hypothetical protein